MCWGISTHDMLNFNRVSGLLYYSKHCEILYYHTDTFYRYTLYLYTNVLKFP